MIVRPTGGMSGIFVLSALLLVLSGPAVAQVSATRDARRPYVSRDQLTDLWQFYQGSAASPAYSQALRDRADVEARAVQARLEEGDFQEGDRVVLRVEGQPSLSDTFQVATGQTIRFPDLGEFEVRGVLRSELRARLADYLGRYVRDLRLESLSLIRIRVDGAVSRPGFHFMPSETPLPDAVMLFAGGPVSDADLSKIQVERRGRKVVSDQQVQQAVEAGTTLDELGLRGGDRIVVPRRTTLGGSEGTLRSLSLILALPFTIVGVISLFR